MSTVPPLDRVLAQFAVDGELRSAVPHGGGHINDSYLVELGSGDGVRRFLLQRVNSFVYPRADRLMENTALVSSHVAAKARAEGRRSPTLVPTREGDAAHTDEDGDLWRLFPFVEHTRVEDAVGDAATAEQAARGFGTFLRWTADLEPSRLAETIPDFHDTPQRYAALDAACASASADRLAAARAELDFVAERRPRAGALVDLGRRGELPLRVVHNDCKMTNVLLDSRSGSWTCVVDLDNCMPGLAPFDFGDMVRSMTCSAREDERDLTLVALQRPLFEAIARGYLAEAGAHLTAAEREHLVTGGTVITLEQGVRFLTDFLLGDVYYKTARPGHNLDRCRTQLGLVASLEAHEEWMRDVVAGLG